MPKKPEHTSTVEAGYQTLEALKSRRSELQELLSQVEKDLDQTKDDLKKRIHQGQGRDNPIRDFVFVACGGEVNSAFINLLVELNGRVTSHAGQLVLVIDREDLPRRPRGGVVLSHHRPRSSTDFNQPDERRTLRLFHLEGLPIRLDPRHTDHLTISGQLGVVERVSLVTVRDEETGEAELKKSKPGPVKIKFEPFGEGVAGLIDVAFNKLSGTTELPPVRLPEIVIGNQAVEKWLLDHNLHHESGGIPSAFDKMMRLLAREPAKAF